MLEAIQEGNDLLQISKDHKVLKGKEDEEYLLLLEAIQEGNDLLQISKEHILISLSTSSQIAQFM